jgi:2-hydroxychromene-2-carboxylate isomerase
VDNTLTAPTVTTWKYPHPEEYSDSTLSRINRKVGDIKRRYPESIDTAKRAARDVAPDLDAIEDALDNLIRAMDDVDRLADEHSPATAAALTIEAEAFSAYYATIED